MSTQSTLTEPATDTYAQYTVGPGRDGELKITNREQNTSQTISGKQLDVARGTIRRILKDTDTDCVDDVVDGNLRTRLNDRSASKLWILFAAINPVRKLDRLQSIISTISSMDVGECYYWKAQIESDNTPNGKTALRTLCAGR